MLEKGAILTDVPTLGYPHVNRILQRSLWESLGVIYVALLQI
jgi:hypothetical protein